MNQLRDDFSNYFGYLPELIEMFLDLFPPNETMEFLEANETPRPLTIRTNTLKTRRRDLAQALINRCVQQRLQFFSLLRYLYFSFQFHNALLATAV